jgi:AraC-like DNA-binding protein
MKSPSKQPWIVALNSSALPQITYAGISRDAPGTRYSEYQLSALELNVITSGSAAATLDGEPHQTQPGHAYLYHPGQIYCGGQSDPKRGTYICRWVKFQWEGWNSRASSALSLPRQLAMAPDVQQNICAAFDTLLELHAAGRPGWNIGAAGQLLTMLGMLIDISARVTASSKGANAPIDRRLSKACTFMEQNLRRRIKIGDIAAAADLAEDYFARLFRKRLRASPLQYLIRLRLQEGRRLMAAQPGMTVRQVSAAAGFDDPRHFAHLFRKHYAVTPDQFRRGMLRG